MEEPGPALRSMLAQVQEVLDLLDERLIDSIDVQPGTFDWLAAEAAAEVAEVPFGDLSSKFEMIADRLGNLIIRAMLYDMAHARGQGEGPRGT